MTMAETARGPVSLTKPHIWGGNRRVVPLGTRRVVERAGLDRPGYRSGQQHRDTACGRTGDALVPAVPWMCDYYPNM
jgi:hypothetical protein